MNRVGNGKASSVVALPTDVDRPSGLSVVLIERRALVRECFAASLQRASGYNVLAFPSAEKWLQSADPSQACLVVLCTSDDQKEGVRGQQISEIAKHAECLPLVVICEDEDAEQIMKALEAGARGVIPTSLPLPVAVEAMRLVTVGGTFVPASCLTTLQRSSHDTATADPAGAGIFTSRQAAVIEALRKGKANKIIAYELNMRESTVKVHVRNIMKKLKARNRTEVAYIANGMMASNRRPTQIQLPCPAAD
jgi:DNA-binding NarL/FixJ family response regulator